MSAALSHSGLTARPEPREGQTLLGRFLPRLAGALVAPAPFGGLLSRDALDARRVQSVTLNQIGQVSLPGGPICLISCRGVRRGSIRGRRYAGRALVSARAS